MRIIYVPAARRIGGGKLGSVSNPRAHWHDIIYQLCLINSKRERWLIKECFFFRWITPGMFQGSGFWYGCKITPAGWPTEALESLTPAVHRSPIYSLVRPQRSISTQKNLLQRHHLGPTSVSTGSKFTAHSCLLFVTLPFLQNKLVGEDSLMVLTGRCIDNALFSPPSPNIGFMVDL